ncbi:hypothetical protein BGX26_000805 [Mortierella sp. AD094]|nr:hypothetical protein BGX26_000805 [Mortierella sp. AD094]
MDQEQELPEFTQGLSSSWAVENHWNEYEEEHDSLDTDSYGDFMVRAKVPPLSQSRHTYTTKTVSKNLPYLTTLCSNALQQLPLKRNLNPVILPTLPPEVLHLIFYHLDNTALCNRISLVSEPIPRPIPGIKRRYPSRVPWRAR